MTGRGTVLALAFLHLVGCPQGSLAASGPSAPLGGVPTLDERAWLAELLAQRPELVMQHEGSISDPAWLALVIRPRWRKELLEDPNATYDTIVAREYTDAEREIDRQWAESLRAAETALPPTQDVHPGRYNVQIYASYEIRGGASVDADGRDYKVFFELDDAPTTLTPARYLAFSEALAAAGFTGDSKIDLRPGAARFQYNNVIVHAPSIQDAECAEAVGTKQFAGVLLHVGRGIDSSFHGRELDWHHYLLTAQYDFLPKAIRDFVEYRAPASGDPCAAAR